MSNTNDYRGKAGAYGLLASNAYSSGERALMLRLQRSCLSLANRANEQHTLTPETEGNGANDER